MIALIITLIVLGIVSYLVSLYVKGDIYVSPVIGAMVGALHSKTEYDKTIEHTLQVCIFVVAITVVWEEPIG